MPTKIKILNKSKLELPKYKHEGDSGMDVRANIEKPITISSLERVLIPTGIFVELPKDYEIQVRPRSGLAINHGITVLNTPGTVDENYRGEIKIILANVSKEDFTVNPGDRIAQLVLAKVEKAELEEIEYIDESTERGGTGFGNSGLQ